MDEGRKDVLGGSLLIVAGTAIALYCYTSYDLGSMRRMGTGFFPMMAGALLAFLGAVVSLPPILRGTKPGAFAPPPLRSTFLVMSSVGAFALLVRPFGLFPAIAALATLASIASRERTPLRELAIMITILCLLAWFIFGFGMSLGLRMLNWPW